MRALVIGDIMVDQTTKVLTNRNAAEADIPVWDHQTEMLWPGGAANTARNLKAIGQDSIEVFLCGIVGEYHHNTIKHLTQANMDLVVNGPTMIKHRFVDHRNNYVFRYDNFQKFDKDDVEWFETVMGGHLFHDFDVVVMSDYNKGTITPEIVQMVKNAPLTVVDSKREDLSLFDGIKVLKLNEHEYSAQVSSRNYTNFTKFFQHCVITKGENGAELQMCEHVKSSDNRYIVHSEKFPTDPQKAFDVTGCGDTFTAALAYDLIKSGGDIRRAIRFANFCAGKVVQKFGTETV